MNFNPIIPWYIILITELVLVVFTTICIFRKKYRRLNYFLRIGIVFFISIALMRPYIKTQIETDVSDNNLVIYFILDNTGSMAVKDMNGKTRLETAKDDILKISESFAGSKFSIIAHDIITYQVLPATRNVAQLKATIEGLHTKASNSSNGSDLKQLLNNASVYISKYKENNSDDEFIIFFLSDGDNKAINANSTSLLADNFKDIIGGAVIGYGSATGAKVPNITQIEGKYAFAQSTKEPYLIDNSKNPIISAINESFLKEVADTYKFDNIKSDGIDKTTGNLKRKLNNIVRVDSTTDMSNALELYWVAMIIAIVLLLIDFARTFNTLLNEREAKHA